MKIINWFMNLFRSKKDQEISALKTIDLANGRKALVDDQGNFKGWKE